MIWIRYLQCFLPSKFGEYAPKMTRIWTSTGLNLMEATKAWTKWEDLKISEIVYLYRWVKPFQFLTKLTPIMVNWWSPGRDVEVWTLGICRFLLCENDVFCEVFYVFRGNKELVFDACFEGDFNAPIFPLRGEFRFLDWRLHLDSVSFWEFLLGVLPLTVTQENRGWETIPSNLSMW